MPSVELGKITTDIPARMDRLPWARWHWMIVIGLGTVWILDGLEVTIVGSMSEALKPTDTGLGLTSSDIGLAGAIYVAGACIGRPVLRSADRPVRPQEAVHDHAWCSTPSPRCSPRSRMNPIWYFVCRFLTGCRHRRGVRRDQLRDRRADPRPVPRPDRHRDQRLVLGRRGRGRPAHHPAARSDHVIDPETGVAAGVRARRRARHRDLARPPARAGEPALAVHPRPGGRGREDRPRHRGDPSRRPADLRAIRRRPSPSASEAPSAWP